MTMKIYMKKTFDNSPCLNESHKFKLNIFLLPIVITETNKELREARAQKRL